MADDPSELALPTRVARAIPNGNDYFGFRVERDFTDGDAYWRGLLLAVGASPASFAHLSIVKRLAGCNLVADPRIWPLKIARLAASFGGALPGVCAGSVFLEDAMIGPLTARHAAEFLLDISTHWTGEDSGEALARELGRRRLLGRRFPGYGVAFRPLDERVGVIDRIVREEGRDGGKYWRTSKLVESLLSDRRPLPRNAGCAAAAALLDCRLSPRQVGLITWSYVVPTYLANAVEGAEQEAPALQQLPASAVRYDGPPPRVSPAAAAGHYAPAPTGPRP